MGMDAWAYVLAVKDLHRIAAYFRDVLGFRVLWEDGTDWRLVQRENVRFMIGHCPDDKPAAEIGDHSLVAYVNVDDVDRLHEEVAARGAVIRIAPTDRPWGMREMIVATPEGHRILFGQDLKKAKA